MTPEETLGNAELNYIQHFMLERTGIALEKNRACLVELRISNLLRDLHFSRASDLVNAIHMAPLGAVASALIDALTTSETSFFRDRTPFDILGQEIVPDICKRSAYPLRIWSAACASGQEALSIAMTIAETSQQLLLQTKILASDISQQALLQAQCGEYSELEVNRGLPARLLMKYFTRAGRNWRAKPSLMSRIVFRDLNLVHLSLKETFDVVFLRNMLIYLDDAAKRTVLKNVARCMSAGAYLFLGGAETVIGLGDFFETVRFGSNLCYRLKK